MRRSTGWRRAGPLRARARPRIAVLIVVAILAPPISAAAVPADFPNAGPADTGSAPTYLRTLGGPNHAQMYPGGIEVGPQGNIVVADTANDRVLKYSPTGGLIWAEGHHGGGVDEFQQPRDVG